MSQTTPSLLKETVPDDLYGKRLDQALAILFPMYSRARLQSWLKSGDILVDGKSTKARLKVLGGEEIVLTPPESAHDQKMADAEPEAISLEIIYEDEAIIVINKPVGLVVHPGAGNKSGTLLNGLLHYSPQLKQVPRAGIVHRLDKDTSGLLVVAKTIEAQTHLVRQLENRDVEREYEAIIFGQPITGAKLVDLMGRHPTQRTKMAVITPPCHQCKEAITRYSVEERFAVHSKIKVNLETGRTHQIRVHMAHNNYPIVGDQVYGGRLRLPKKSDESLKEFLTQFNRQALHARQLGLINPSTNEWMQWQAATPEDMQQLCKLLRLHAEYSAIRR